MIVVLSAGDYVMVCGHVILLFGVLCSRRISRQGGGWMEEDMADNKAGAREGTAVTSQQEKSDRQTILPNKPPE